MSKNKLLLLLALLMTAATGAWAQTNLSEVTAAYTAQDGETLTGTLSANVKISIADGATVTLDGVTINGANDEDCKWAGINCAGGATIILKGANTVKGFYEDYPGIHVPQGKTLTIKGDGSLDASSNGYGAGIGGGYEISCGNIFIEGGTIVATGGDLAAGIGGGGNGSCGIIMISDAVTKVVATKVEDRSPCSIGSGAGGSCATVEIGGKVYENGIADSPYTYPTYSVTLADGTVDAKNWTITSGQNSATGDAADGLTGLSEKDAVTLQYNGRLKVKGVKATSDEKPAEATYTLLSAATTSDCGKVVCAAGHLHDAKTAVPDGCTAVGILGKVTETGHGLILALQDATSQTWNTINGWESVTTYAGTTLKVLPDDAARGTNLTSYTALGATAVSNWAVGGHPDYEAIFKNLGGAINDWQMYLLDSNVNDYITTGVGGSALDGEYWPAWPAEELAQELMEGDAIMFSINNWTADQCYNSKKIRPVLGFGGEAGEPAAKTPATVTTAPTGAAIVGAGQNMALVSGGEADGGTLMYAVTTTNTKPASTDGFSGTVPTAETITARGTVYVWYYVKGDDTHTDSEIAATAIEVPVADIVWDATNISELYVYGNDQSSDEKEGVTLSANGGEIYAMWINSDDPTMTGISFEPYESGGFTFTAPTGKKFTKIEMKANGPYGWNSANLGTGWAYSADYTNNIYKVTWTGSAASTDKLLPDTEDFGGETISYIAFTLVDAE